MIDILIIGAGPSGLCMAKTYLQYDKTKEILLVDAHSSVGGVWAKEELYPTLRTNNLFSSVDFTDFPMGQDRFGIKPGEHVTGEAMHEYLSAYAEHFDLTSRIRFRTKVTAVKQRFRESDSGPDGWAVEVEDLGSGAHTTMSCTKLVIATGVLSVPNIPHLRGASDFHAPLVHSSDLGQEAASVMENPDIKTIAVLGGCKSAYDAVYLAASTGHRVEWIIRKSGRGPTWVFPTHTYLGPILAWRERLITRRIFSFMSPSIFPDFSGFEGLRNSLQFGRFGSFIKEKFWAAIYADTLRDCRYRTDDMFKILEPEQAPFWYGTASGTLNYEEDFLSFVKNGQVKIHRQDISHLSHRKVHLVTGTNDTEVPGSNGVSELDVDALVASTGYSAKPTVSFSPSTLHSDLGLPTTSLTPEQQSFWSELDSKADIVIGQKFPQLIKGPPKPRLDVPASSEEPRTKPINLGAASEANYTPWRLYRGIAPPGLTDVPQAVDRSIIFIGMFSNIANTIRLEIQCLWGLAYLENKLPHLDASQDGHVDMRTKIFEETAVLQRYAQHRAPYGHGRFYPDLVFDQLPYWDVLLKDLGLKTRRKGGFMGFRELFEPYTQTDYRGLVDEWLAQSEVREGTETDTACGS
ncbi:putative dimethylaniline monooxygenase [Naviculisporaceae sp. PSN 640]